MIKKQNIICISSIDWNFVWQGHQEIMSAFAKQGNRALFIENTGVRIPTFKDLPRLKSRVANWLRSVKGFRQEEENLFIFSPVILPFPYSKIAQWINKYMLLNPIKRWMDIMDFHNPIVWTFLPTGTALNIINNIDKKLVVYYCIADFYELADSPKKVKVTEDELIRKSDVIFAQGDALAKKCRRLNDKVYIFPFGVKSEVFENFDKNTRTPAGMEGIKRPIIGYVGGIHRHIDFGMLKAIATAHPDWSIVLVGPIQTDISEISGLKNVFLPGKKDIHDLPGYINEFDAAIIPYRISEYTATVYPTKLNEYHMFGKPVISTALPEIINFNARNNGLVLIGRSQEEFIRCISEAIGQKDSGLYDRRVASAKANSWDSRIEEMSRICEEALEQKTGEPFDWRKKLVVFYRRARRNTVKLGLAFILLYIVLLKTPFIWFIASPLRISETPQKADVIVVFGGGAGETGSPGKSTIERARQAAELYKSGYADKIIFSSGYTYTYNDAENMKLIALPIINSEKDIILEQKANSVYQNVIFSKEILDKNKWRSILLVSSPYNMRRASLVFRKWGKDIKVVYTPVIQCQFYDRSTGVGLEQIRAIMHEYLGIIYYKFKGYI
jgi:uncharacterized SAM-binding protein YcdF (DUF218 family)